MTLPRWNKRLVVAREEQAKQAARARHLKARFGITIDQYDSLLEKQDGCCAICSRTASTFRTRLAVDHNHQTGEIRGLLCSYCNHRVIGRHKDGNLLRRMADYVDQGTGWYVPARPQRKRRNAKR